MNSLRVLRGCVAAALAAAAALGARAHGPDIVTTVTPADAAAVYSRAANATASPPRPGQTNFVAYTVVLRNADDETLFDVRFSGTTRVTEPTEAAQFASAQGATCTPDTAGTGVECAVGALAKGQSARFTLFFTTPVRTTTLPAGDAANCSATDCIAFSGKTRWTEIDTDRYGTRSETEYGVWRAAAVTLGAGTPGQSQTAVPPTGATLATGDAAVTLATDLFTTQVVVPAGYLPPAGSLPIARIAEATDAAGCSALNECFRSDITVPGTISPYLTIVLRVDASNIRKGRKIQQVTVTYDGIVVGDCAGPTMPRTDGIPCIVQRKVYPLPRPGKGGDRDDDDDDKRKPLPAPPGDLDGDFEWTLINTRNGSYKVF